MTVSTSHSMRENRSTPATSSGFRTELTWRAARFALVLLASGLPMLSRAQTCVAPDVLLLQPGGPPFSYTTCSNSEPSGLTLCNGAVVTNAPSHVFNLFIRQGNTLVLTLGGDGGAGFTPRMYLIGGAACDSGDCSVSTGALPLHDESPGQHQLVVTGNPDDAAGNCRNFTLSLTGDPGSDEIFQDGFDQNPNG